MTDPIFWLPDLSDPLPGPGTLIELAGAEGHHAAVVRRLRIGERLRIGDGRGRAILAQVAAVERRTLTVEVIASLPVPPPKPHQFVAAQAPAKGDRSELAVELLTEVGIDEIVPWRAGRAVVRWSADREPKALARWTATASEAAKQSRRLTIPTITEPVDTEGLATLITGAALALVLHESATLPLREVPLPAAGRVLFVVGPEGGIADEELDRLERAGARIVRLGETVLRASTAGAVALAGVTLR